MAYFHPCHGCAVDKETCARRSEIRSAIAGLSITSVKFKCKDRKPFYHMGQRVSFPWSVCIGQDDDGEGVFRTVNFNGTIVCEASKPSRFTVRVDQDGEGYTESPNEVFRNGGDVVNVKTHSLSLLDEPVQNMCANCLKYEGEDGRCPAHPNAGWDTYIPPGCIDHAKTGGA